MKREFLLFLILCMSFSAQAENIKWHDASEFPLYGKITDKTNARYERLPGYMETQARKPVWELSRNSTGLYIRFRSDSPELTFNWETLTDRRMPHMPDTGSKGLDLYRLTDDGWTYVKCCRPRKGPVFSEKIECDEGMREYMLYLSLYDGVKSLKIGIKEGYVIEMPEADSPRSVKPVIMYGSSILQGGCCSRPGMAHTNILARMLDREVINLGFSGNAKIDYEIAEFMASFPDPGLFVLDYAPNCNAEMIDERAEKFFRIIRDAHPDVPVVFVALPPYPRATFNSKKCKNMQQINEAQRRVYDRLKKAGEKKIYYVKSEGMLGDDLEATVDGTHFTDLGMMRYADHVYPTLKKALRCFGSR